MAPTHYKARSRCVNGKVVNGDSSKIGYFTPELGKFVVSEWDSDKNNVLKHLFLV